MPHFQPRSGGGYGGHRHGGRTGGHGWSTTKPQTEKVDWLKEKPNTVTRTQQQSLVKFALQQVVFAEPSLRTLYVACDFAYALYQNRDKINELYENLQDGNILDASVSAATLTGKLLSNSLVPIRDDIANLIGASINLEDGVISDVFDTVMDKFTASEVNFLTDYMAKNKIFQPEMRSN